MESFEVRDHRNKSMFRVDDEYLNGYAKLCGTNATLVYLCLCRHADRNQESFPSVIGMAEKLGISRDSVMRGIKTLIEWNIISKKRERKQDAKWLNNKYILLDKSVWKAKPKSQVANSDMEEKISQVANRGVAKSQILSSQVAHSDTKVTHTKVAHKEGNTYISEQSSQIVLIIDEFKKWNPAAKRWYGNKTQRTACADLIESYGLDPVIRVIPLLQKTNKMMYMPKITTALQLFEKWEQIKSHLETIKQKKQNTLAVYEEKV